jgi:5-methylcytosine-specific restriction endonuclease McrA
MSASVSLYNASFEKIFELDWKKAVLLYISGKVIEGVGYVDVNEEYPFIDIKTPSGVFRLPKHIILKKYVYIPYRDFSPTRKNIFRRDNHSCQYCGCELDSQSATIDHILPRSKGGMHKWENVVACCLKCNRKKGDRTPQEAKMPLLSTPKPLKFCNA